jgi:hypothetical protein
MLVDLNQSDMFETGLLETESLSPCTGAEFN